MAYNVATVGMRIDHAGTVDSQADVLRRVAEEVVVEENVAAELTAVGTG